MDDQIHTSKSIILTVQLLFYDHEMEEREREYADIQNDEQIIASSIAHVLCVDSHVTLYCKR